MRTNPYGFGSRLARAWNFGYSAGREGPRGGDLNPYQSQAAKSQRAWLEGWTAGAAIRGEEAGSTPRPG